jgi:hypothetical protein
MPYVIDVLPELVEEMVAGVRALGSSGKYPDELLKSLEEQLPSLELIGRCGRDDHFCSSLNVRSTAGMRWGESHRAGTIEVSRKGYVNLHVVDGDFMGVEILFRPEIKTRSTPTSRSQNGDSNPGAGRPGAAAAV